MKDDVVLIMLKHTPNNNNNNNLILTNVLEYVTVIIDYCTALTIIKLEKVIDDPYPILINMVEKNRTQLDKTHLQAFNNWSTFVPFLLLHHNGLTSWH